MKKAALGTFLLGAAIGTFTTLRLKRYAQTKGLPKKIKRSQGEYYAHDSTRDKFYKIEAQEFKELIASDNYSEAPDQKAGETIYTLKILKEGGQIPPHTKIQTLIFDKNKFTKADSRTWAYEHGFRHRTIEETENSYRIRQENPENFKSDSFRTIELKEGIKSVIGLPNENEFAEGGKVFDAKTQEQITKLEKAIASPATPENFKKQMEKQLAILKTRKPAESTQKTETEKQEKVKQALKELELSAENIEACQKVINEHRKQQRDAAGPQPKKKRITIFKEKMESITGFLSKQVKQDEKAQEKIKNLTEKYIVSVGLVIFGSDAKGLAPKKVKEMVEEKFAHSAKMSVGGRVDASEIVYRLMNHDSTHTDPIFEKFTIEELNNQFGTSYISAEEAIDDDPEYIFSKEEMEEYKNQ